MGRAVNTMRNMGWRRYAAGMLAVVLAITAVLTIVANQPVSAAVEYVSAVAANNGSGSSSLTIGKPSSTDDGHVMIAVVGVRGGSGTTITAPDGWTEINAANSGTTLRSATYYKVASDEGASYAFGFSSSLRASGVISTYSGVDTSNPIDAESVQANSSSSTMTAAGITMTTDETTLVGMYSMARSATFSAGSSMTLRGQSSSTGGSATDRTTSGLQDAPQGTAGASGNKTMTAGNSAVNIGHLVALTPAPLTLTMSASSYRWYEPETTMTGNGTFVHQASPATLPAGVGRSVAWSSDEQYMAVGHSSSPRITIYKRSGDTFTKLSNPGTVPPSDGNGASFSPDGQYLAVAHLNSPYVSIYKRSGDTFTKLADPANLPSSHSYSVTWSPDSVYMAVAGTGGSNITIYKRSGDTFTSLNDIDTTPPNTSNGASFSPDGQYLSVAHNSSPFVTIYKRSGDTFTKLANPATLPASIGNGTAWSPDGQYMSVAHGGSPRITIYKRSGDTFTALDTPDTIPPGDGLGVAWSPDGQSMSVVHAEEPYLTIYKRNNDTFTKLADPATLPPNTGRGVAWSLSGQYMSVAHSTSPYITVYKPGMALATGTPLAGQDAPVSMSSGSSVRLRQSVRVDGMSLDTEAEFKLQYGAKVSTCAAASYIDVGSSGFAYYNNPGAGHDAPLGTSGNDPTDGARTNTAQSFVRAHPFLAASSVSPGDNALWDFSLAVAGAEPGIYCFRIVQANGTPLGDYLQYPELEVISAGPTLEQRMRGGQSVINGVKSPLRWE